MHVIGEIGETSERYHRRWRRWALGSAEEVGEHGDVVWAAAGFAGDRGGADGEVATAHADRLDLRHRARELRQARLPSTGRNDRGGSGGMLGLPVQLPFV